MSEANIYWTTLDLFLYLPSEFQWIEINFIPLRPRGFGNFHRAGQSLLFAGIIRLLFGFASDLTNSTNLQILRRQCSLLLPAASITQKVTFKSHIYSITFVAIYVQYSVLTNQRWIMLDTRIRVATPPHFRLNIDTILCLSPPTISNKPQQFFSSAVEINATSPITFFLVFSPYLLDFTGKLGQCPLYIFYSYNLGDLALELYLSQCFTSFAARCWVSDSADQWPSLSLPQIALLVFDIFQIHSRHIICLKTISPPGWWWGFHLFCWL